MTILIPLFVFFGLVLFLSLFMLATAATEVDDNESQYYGCLGTILTIISILGILFVSVCYFLY